ncbi:putative adhesin [Murinocardiopsis flavida]|uniref:Putative adhesin n=1 Tax=Murinocardiopsis flavida TaxID=645275 RepID=A0A2P8CXE7_9ACTN|nr:DUF4097 family beta strand repeat-containing protein [Murinocardiopsis flavida]PSK89619.1 putative adhesin [Murinocardiopsis flavida]
MTFRNRPRRIPRAVGGTLLALATLAACGGPAEDAAPEERGFGPVGPRLTIAVGSGELDVRPADVDEVTVRRWFTAWSITGTKAEPAWEFEDDRLTLTAECGPAVLSGCDARYEVRVPRSTRLTVDGGSGAVTAAGFDTPLRIDSDNGAVRVDDAASPLSLRTTSGGLRATGIRSDRVDARSENGRIHLSFAAVPDDVEAAAENGGVTVEVPEAAYDVTTATDNGEVRNGLGKDSGSRHRITARTDNGAIRLRTTS